MEKAWRRLTPTRIVTGLAALSLATLAVAGCGGGGSKASGVAPAATGVATVAGDGIEHLTLHANDSLMFAPATLTAKVGTLVVTYINDGSIAHTLRIKGIQPVISNLNGHSQTTLTVKLTKPGTYYVECDYHPSMVGTLVVTQ